MGLKLKQRIPASIAILCAVFMPSPRASAQATVSLQEQLVAQYKLVKMGSDTSGYSVIEQGTLLAIQKGGILGVSYSDQSVLSTKYENGTVHTPSTLLSKGIGFGMKKFGKEQTTKLFPKGDKVYPMKIDVNLEKDTVLVGIVACDTCNKTDPPTYNKANVVFQFPKGTLAKASAGDVEDTIGQLLSISDDSQQQDQGGQQQGQNQGQGQGGGGGGQGGGAQGGGGGGQEQAQSEPQTIQLGMTTDQVQQALGTPTKIVNLGPKQIYVYKDLKVTFFGGKVVDVQ
jgi:uncharacterized membrane protein YgcG